MNLETITRRLSEWKEKILFCAVLLIAVYVARNGSPLGAGIDTIDAETRNTALQAAKLDETAGIKALEQLQKPPDLSPTPADPAEISRLFFDERDVFKPNKSSGWMLGKDSFLRLPPLPLVVPGFPALCDFDLPAGPSPDLVLARGMVPRDNRKVTLTVKDTGEFK